MLQPKKVPALWTPERVLVDSTKVIFPLPHASIESKYGMDQLQQSARQLNLNIFQMLAIYIFLLFLLVQQLFNL